MNKVFTFFEHYFSCLPTIFSNGSIKNSEAQTVAVEPNYKPINIRLELIQTNNGFEIKRNDLTDSVDSRLKKEKPINIRLEVDPTNNSIEIKPNDSTNNDSINNSTSSNSSKNSINIQLELVPVNNVINSNDSRPTNNEFVDIALPKSNTTKSKSIINPNCISKYPQLADNVLFCIQLEETPKNIFTDPSYNQVNSKSIENDSTNIQLKALQPPPEDVHVERKLNVSDVLNKSKSYHPIKLQSIQNIIPEEMHLNNAMDIEHDSIDILDLQLIVNPEDVPIEKELTVSVILNERKDVLPEELHLKNTVEIKYDSDGFTIYDNSSETGHASTDDWNQNNFLNDWTDDWNQNHISTDDWADDSNRQDHSADVWDVDYFTDDLKVIHVDDNVSTDNCTDDDLSHKDHLVDVWDLDYFTDTLNDVEDLTDIVIFNEEDPTDFLNSKDDDVKVPIIIPTIDLKVHQLCPSELLSTVWDWYVNMTDDSEIQKQFANSDKKIKLRTMDKFQIYSEAKYTSKFIRTDHIIIYDTLPSKPICTLDID
ncbi:9453_t:CDS:2, partial [Dentiscutata erythropus]